MPSCDSPAIGASVADYENTKDEEYMEDIRVFREKVRKALQENQRVKDILAERELKKFAKKLNKANISKNRRRK